MADPWRVCGGDYELFFPVGSSGPALRQIELAKQVCGRCDVVDMCLKWAMETGQDSGVWGGRSEDERRAPEAPGVPIESAKAVAPLLTPPTR